ncbi:hypothetical protein V2J09_021183 [Rumex salicifolius]
MEELGQDRHNFSRKRWSPDDLYRTGHKRRKVTDELSKVIDYSDPFAVPNLLESINSSKYGSVTKDVEALLARNMQVFKFNRSCCPVAMHIERTINPINNVPSVPVAPVVILDSDEEEDAVQKPSFPLQQIDIQKQAKELLLQRPVSYEICMLPGTRVRKEKEKSEEVKEKDRGIYLGVDFVEHNDGSGAEDNGLGDIWNEMTVALEVSKDVSAGELSDIRKDEDEQDCDHSYVLKDDIGYVCRVCGIIDKGIESIIEIQYKKPSRSRAYHFEGRGAKDEEHDGKFERMNFSAHKVSLSEEIIAHPRHMKQMKPHQIEGFNFLKSNLLDTENPGGCILAHAPGSGKTFMIISFMQSFLAKYPNGRPLVVLPKGILSTWKKEFVRWQIEDFPLLDFYSVKADSRKQQYEVLMQWKEKRSILFLGYKQFSAIVTDNSQSDATKGCQEILLHLPTILILDEGHTPRNEDTDMLHSLAKVETPRKVVLSGTLYQNHVKEVFNILNLVRPKFMKLETSRVIRKRIMCFVDPKGARKQLKGTGDAPFFESVEYTLQQDKDSRRKAAVIRDLREMTSRVLHYYRGDFLDELPGLVDFTVLVKLTPWQRIEVDRLKKGEKGHFRRNAQGSALYVHPKLKQFTEMNAATGEKATLVSEEKLDQVIETINLQEGVKARFFMSMLRLCEASNEKLLVFSQYLLPLKFLQRLSIQVKGWQLGKEIFEVTGDTNADQREWSMERFNKSTDAKVFFGSIKACGEGISLVGASRIIILDVHLNPSVSRQAIGRAFRPGQVKKVFSYRLVAAESPEEEDHLTCFKKELIAKRWFEWNDFRGNSLDFEMEEVDIKDSGDMFLESPALAGDVKALHRRSVLSNHACFKFEWCPLI